MKEKQLTHTNDSKEREAVKKAMVKMKKELKIPEIRAVFVRLKDK